MSAEPRGERDVGPDTPAAFLHAMLPCPSVCGLQLFVLTVQGPALWENCHWTPWTKLLLPSVSASTPDEPQMPEGGCH